MRRSDTSAPPARNRLTRKDYLVFGPNGLSRGIVFQSKSLLRSSTQSDLKGLNLGNRGGYGTTLIRIDRRVVAALAACLLSLTLAPSSAGSAPSATERLLSVIVQSSSGSSGAAAAVESVGGEVTKDLSIINGVGAKVPASILPVLRSKDDIVQVQLDARVGFHGGPDQGVTHRIQKVVRSDKLWNEGVTGQGVAVAVLDTGIYAGHPDLAGRVVHCEDLTAERNTVAHCADTFGHGTFMAGLIAGNGASSNGKYKGAAPNANLVAIKAAGYDGSTDVSTILAGIQFAVAHKDTYGIRVLNLSLGTDSSQDYRLSPLNYAVQQAWKAGIVVVVSAGNSGNGPSTVMKPGDDPFVITVGASNDEGSMTINDDRIPVFSSRGPTRANGLMKPDVVSPGVRTISLRSPGSAIDNQFGSTAVVDGNYFRGTGTSMSTATVSGVVAQMLSRNTELSPNQVKFRLMETAREIADSDPVMVGRGLVDAYAAATTGLQGEANQGLEESNGLGLLQADRGSLAIDVVTPVGQIGLFGEFLAQTDPSEVSTSNPGGLVPWVAASWKTEGWDAASWKAASWKAEDWAAASWKAASWKATTWDAASWKGTEWNESSWDAASWKAASWEDFDWDAASWKAASWKAAWYAAAWD